MKNLTAIIVSFLRPQYTIDCVKSLREEYPQIKIIVGEQIKDKPTYDLKYNCKKYDAKYIELPFDCGVGNSRNLLIKEVDTEFVLIGDDDFLYDKNAKVEKMFKFMQNTNFDLIGGRIIEDNKVKNYQGIIEINDKFIRTKPIPDNENVEMEEMASGLKYQQVDLTFNFFVIRTATALKYPWDPNIKVAWEHHHFFVNLKKNDCKVAYSPEPIVKHKFQNYPRTQEYQNFRSRKSDMQYYFSSLGIDYCIDIHNQKILNPLLEKKELTVKEEDALKKILDWIYNNEEGSYVDSVQLNRYINSLRK